MSTTYLVHLINSLNSRFAILEYNIPNFAEKTNSLCAEGYPRRRCLPIPLRPKTSKLTSLMQSFLRPFVQSVVAAQTALLAPSWRVVQVGIKLCSSLATAILRLRNSSNSALRLSKALVPKQVVSNQVLSSNIETSRNDDLARETHIDGSALLLQSIDDIGCADSLALTHLHDGTSIEQQFAQVLPQLGANLLVDGARDALDASTACETTDGGLGDALDIVAENFPVSCSRVSIEASRPVTLCSAIDSSSRHLDFIAFCLRTCGALRPFCRDLSQPTLGCLCLPGRLSGRSFERWFYHRLWESDAWLMLRGGIF